MTAVGFCRPSDVSQALGVSTSTVERWVDEGVLPARKTVGGHRRTLRADVLRLLASLLIQMILKHQSLGGLPRRGGFGRGWRVRAKAAR